jgi:hypothetical protein
MFERFKRNGGNGDGYDDRRPVATAERPVTRHDTDIDTGTERGRFARDRGTTGVMSRDTVRAVRARQREEYGGINWDAAFFGFLVAVGMATILLGLLSAAGAASGSPT